MRFLIEKKNGSEIQ